MNRGYWICALDARELTRIPNLVYRDAEGVEFAISVPLDEPGLPRLWPSQAPSPGRLVAHGTMNLLEQDEWQVEIQNFGMAPLQSPAELIAEQLRCEVARVPSRSIVGSVLGHRHGFELAVHSGFWVAVADCSEFAVTVKGMGDPPLRLDLERLGHSH